MDESQETKKKVEVVKPEDAGKDPLLIMRKDQEKQGEKDKK